MYVFNVIKSLQIFVWEHGRRVTHSSAASSGPAWSGETRLCPRTRWSDGRKWPGTSDRSESSTPPQHPAHTHTHTHTHTHRTSYHINNICVTLSITAVLSSQVLNPSDPDCVLNIFYGVRSFTAAVGWVSVLLKHTHTHTHTVISVRIWTSRRLKPKPAVCCRDEA